MKKGAMNIAVSITIFVIVVAILIFISINNKTKNIPVDSQMGDTSGQNSQENNMQDDTNTTPTDLSAADAQGVKITVTKQGTGAAAKSGDTVSMNYTGTLADGTVFDSNVDPKFQHVEPFDFTLGAGEVIKGWDVGVAGMKVGEKRTLVIQPDYGYGSTGAGGVIPPNAVLTFDVELLAIKN